MSLYGLRETKWYSIVLCLYEALRGETSVNGDVRRDPGVIPSGPHRKVGYIGLLRRAKQRNSYNQPFIGCNYSAFLGGMWKRIAY